MGYKKDLWRSILLTSLGGIVSSLNNGFNLPSLSWSSWNHFQGSISDSLLRECADAIVTSGLRDAGELHWRTLSWIHL